MNAAKREDWDGTERREVVRAKSALEQHTQTVLSAVALALLVWFGSSVVEQGKEQAKSSAVTTIKIEQLERSVASLQSQLTQLSTERVTITDIRRVEDRLDRLERRR
jgi:uncharacterized protein Yka (UPF0111/DUF47 family)